jgi:hypothetical protein
MKIVTLPVLPVVWRDDRSLEIGLATPKEEAAVVAEITIEKEVRGDIADWHLIAVRDHVNRLATLHVLGHHRSSMRWMTAALLGITPDRRFAKTLNSLYRLVTRATKPPTQETLLRVMAAGLFDTGRAGLPGPQGFAREVGHA